MTNLNIPNGFLPYMSPTQGGGGQPKVEYLDLKSTNSAIGRGDPVTLVAGGVDKASASAALCGIAAEPKAASAAGKIAVWVDPQQLFVAQCDSTTGTMTSAVGMRGNVDFVTGTPANGQSTAMLDESTGAATTATLPFKAIRLSDDQLNAYGQYQKVVVKINNHQFGSHTGTAGVAT